MSNVLVVMADEHARWALGAAGSGDVDTPNIDALALSGTRFSHRWTPSPICVPARAAFATGRWVHEIGNWDSAQAWAGAPTGWTHASRAGGREVMSFGKLHHRSGADDDGFTDRVLPMFIAGGIGWVQGLPRRDPLPYDEAAELAADVGAGETTYTRYDRRIAAAATAWISERSHNETPWTAFVSFVAPHYPLSAPEEFARRYSPSDIPPPSIGRIEHTHPAVKAMAAFFDYDASFDDDLTQRARHAYFGLCSFVDHHVGLLLDALDESGQRDNTTIIFTSDHGELLGNRGLWCKSFLYEDSVAVPLIASGPGFAESAVVDTNVNLIDVAATIAELSTSDHASSGHSLTESSGLPADRSGFSEYHDGGSITGSFAVRHGEWKLVHHEGFEPELFNMSDDPNELDDLGTDPRCVNELADCVDVLHSIVDPTAATAAAFASQEALLAELGGREEVTTAFRFNHTPAP